VGVCQSKGVSTERTPRGGGERRGDRKGLLDRTSACVGHGPLADGGQSFGGLREMRGVEIADEGRNRDREEGADDGEGQGGLEGGHSAAMEACGAGVSYVHHSSALIRCNGDTRALCFPSGAMLRRYVERTPSPLRSPRAVAVALAWGPVPVESKE
jgi:hypothetical protein